VRGCVGAWVPPSSIAQSSGGLWGESRYAAPRRPEICSTFLFRASGSRPSGIALRLRGLAVCQSGPPVAREIMPPGSHPIFRVYGLWVGGWPVDGVITD